MKITLLTYGSRGDVAPFVALAKGLIQAGHTIRLAAPKSFESILKSHEIEFVGFPGDPGQLVKNLVDGAGNSRWRMVKSMADYVVPLAGRIFRIARTACQDADMIVHSFLLTSTGYEIARELKVPDVSAQLFPVFTRTAAFPAPSFPDLPLGDSYRQLTHTLVNQVFWQGSRFLYRMAQLKHPELPPLTGWPFDPNNGWQTPILYAFSPAVVPRPFDWREGVHITGYWFSEGPDGWEPSKDLVNFINQDPPPIAITFGSTITQDMGDIFRKVLEALARNKQRGLIVGEGNHLECASPTVFQAAHVPYNWLFERSGVIIHHGGAGTTGKGLMAGVPNIVLPFTSDQPFWGRRVQLLGAGPKPIPPKRLSVSELAQAINAAVSDANMRKQSKMIGEALQREDGVARAVGILEQYGWMHRS